MGLIKGDTRSLDYLYIYICVAHIIQEDDQVP